MFVVILTSDVKDLLNRDSRIMSKIIETAVWLRMVTISSRPVPQLTVTKISTYTIYLYIFITVKTAPQLNRLFRTAQTAVTI